MDPRDAPTDVPEQGHPPQEADRIEFPKLLAVGVVSLVIFAVGVAWAWGILRARRPDLRGPGDTRGASQIGHPEIGIIDQVPFDGQPGPEVSRQRARRLLHEYGWADRRRGLIHVPIEQGIERILREQGAPPAGGGR